jgi:hypothetical protein
MHAVLVELCVVASQAGRQASKHGVSRLPSIDRADRQDQACSGGQEGNATYKDRVSRAPLDAYASLDAPDVWVQSQVRRSVDVVDEAVAMAARKDRQWPLQQVCSRECCARTSVSVHSRPPSSAVAGEMQQQQQLSTNIVDGI